MTEVVGRDGDDDRGPDRRAGTDRSEPRAAAPCGRRSPAATPRSRRSTVLVAVGEEPDPSILPEGAGIEVSAFAGIVADPRTLATGRAGVFAGGDVVSGPKTIIDAVASGRRAAGAIHEYLSGARDGEAEILATGPLPDAAVETSLTPRPRRRGLVPGSRSRSYEPGSFRGRPGRLRRGGRP